MTQQECVGLMVEVTRPTIFPHGGMELDVQGHPCEVGSPLPEKESRVIVHLPILIGTPP
jgi:hypothetical protein